MPLGAEWIGLLIQFRLRKDIAMRTNTTYRSRAALLALSAALLLMARAPLAEAAPDPAAWGESSGYNAIEANRVAASSLVSASAPESGGADTLYSIEANRAMTARVALASGDIGSMQEEALTELVVAADAGSAVAPADERVTRFGRIR